MGSVLRAAFENRLRNRIANSVLLFDSALVCVSFLDFLFSRLASWDSFSHINFVAIVDLASVSRSLCLDVLAAISFWLRFGLWYWTLFSVFGFEYRFWNMCLKFVLWRPLSKWICGIRFWMMFVLGFLHPDCEFVASNMGLGASKSEPTPQFHVLRSTKPTPQNW